MITLADHVFSPIKDNNLDATLDRFARAGFLVNPVRVRHHPGRLNGFVRLTGSYLEFMSVCDEAAFARGAVPEEKFYRAHPHPSGLALRTNDALALHRRLSQFALFPPDFSAHGPAGEALPAWKTCVFPRDQVAGAFVFGIEYLHRQRQRSGLRQGPNTIYALGGVTYCAEEPLAALLKWYDLLKSITRVRHRSATLKLGFQELEWIHPDTYRARMGHPYRGPGAGGIARVKLLCADLDAACAALEAAHFLCLKKDHPRAWFAHDPTTGFAFELMEKPPGLFLSHLRRQERRGRPRKTAATRSRIISPTL